MSEGHVADVIVIGAGIIGAACARSLAQRGLQVLVLDAGWHGATAAGMGHLLVLDDNTAELALSQYSLRRWRELAPALPDACAWRNNGTLWLAANAEEMAVAHRKYLNLMAHGEACELIGRATLHQREPELRADLEGGLLIKGDGILYAPAAARWMLDHANISQQRAEVSEVDGHRVRLADGRWLSAEAVVLANGIQATALCQKNKTNDKTPYIKT